MRLRRPPKSPAARAYDEAAIAPAETPWREAAYAVVDLETTGLDPKEDEIISFAAVPIDAGVRPAARAPGATAIDPVSGRAIDSTGRPLDPASPISSAAIRAHPDGAVDPVTGGTLDPVTGRAIDPVTGKRIEPLISGEIDPATGRRVDPLGPDASRAPR